MEQAKNWTGRQGREVQVPTCRSRVLAGGRCTLHGKILAYASDRVNPDAFGDGSDRILRAPYALWLGSAKTLGQRIKRQ